MGAGLTVYLLVINLIAFCMFGEDKKRARRKKWRISEATLLGAALLGGSAGAWIGMKVFHHKTKHPKFSLGIPVILIVQALILMYLYF